MVLAAGPYRGGSTCSPPLYTETLFPSSAVFTLQTEAVTVCDPLCWSEQVVPVNMITNMEAVAISWKRAENILNSRILFVHVSSIKSIKAAELQLTGVLTDT